MFNPHTGGFKKQNIVAEQECDKEPVLVLKSNSPKRDYIINYHTDAFHAGQLKLSLSEILLLTKYAENGDTVIYAGAAPFKHGTSLFRMFPGIKWILVDPRPFDGSIQSYAKNNPDKVSHRMALFTDKMAMELYKSEKNIIFISDIRRTTLEGEVLEDMRMQESWTRILRPKVYMLKFRPPWEGPRKFDYLPGKIYKQCFPPTLSTETRLIGSDHKSSKTYDRKKYESQMFYHNTVDRLRLYENDMVKYVKGLDRCWDCAAFTIIIREYLEKYKPSYDKKDVAKWMNNVIHSSLASNMTTRYHSHIISKIVKKDEYPNKIISLLKRTKNKTSIVKKLKPLIKKYKLILKLSRNV